MEKEVFDNMDVPPYKDYGDYIHTMSPSMIPEDVFDYQNVPNVRRFSNGSEVRGQARSEVTGQSAPNITSIVEPTPSPRYSNLEAEVETSGSPRKDTYINVQTDSQETAEEKDLLKPKLSHTSSSNSYTHSPISSPKYRKEIGGSQTDEDSYFLLCEASSRDVNSKCMSFTSGDASLNYIPRQSVVM